MNFYQIFCFNLTGKRSIFDKWYAQSKRATIKIDMQWVE